MFSSAYFEEDCKTIVMHRSIPLIKYFPKVNKKLKNLIASGSEDSVEEEIPILDELGNKIYEPYLKRDLYVYLVNDYTIHAKASIPQ